MIVQSYDITKLRYYKARHSVMIVQSYDGTKIRYIKTRHGATTSSIVLSYDITKLRCYYATILQSKARCYDVVNSTKL